MLLKNPQPPLLPAIEGGEVLVRELERALYTRHPPPGYSIDRLALRGRTVLGMVVSDHLLNTRPLVDAETIKTRMEAILQEESVLQWLDLYPDVKARFEHGSTEDPLSLDNQQLCDFFLSYVGAVYLSRGCSIRPVLENWIVGLIALEGDEPEPTVTFSNTDGSSSECIPSADAPPGYYQSFTTLPTPPISPIQSMGSPLISPSATTSNSPRFGYSSTSRIGLNLVNKMVTLNGLNLSYRTEKKLSSNNQEQWTLRCMLNGSERGRGTGPIKIDAKEEAAYQACVTMGWI